MDYSKKSNDKKRKKRGSRKEKLTNSTGIIIFRVIIATILIAGFAAAGALFGAYFGILQNAPKITSPNILPNIYTSYIVDKDMNEIDRLEAEENRIYVSFDQVPQSFKDALVAIEDERFYSHSGVDLRGMFRALYVNLTDPNRTEGASTITQQLIKNNILELSRNTLETKLQEQYMAVQYEKELTESYGGNKETAKNYILEVYMNTIALGHNLNGIQAAANYYFDKDASELTLSESAVIAGITQWPSRYVPDTKPEDNKKRRKMVLDKMLELEMITQREYDEAMADDPYSRISQSAQVLESESYHSYFNDHLIRTVAADLRNKFLSTEAEAYNYLYNGGLTIVSTQDLKMQKIMDESYENDDFFPKEDYEVDVQYYLSTRNTLTNKLTHHPMKRGQVKSMDDVDAFVEATRDTLLGANDEVEYERVIPVPQPQSAMVIIDQHTGEVKSLTGGRGEKMVNLALNRATASERQPGSVFKVLASFAPGIDMGVITAASVIDDVPFVTGNDHQFRNWYRNPAYRGLSTVREGIYNSMNVLTVKNMYNVGIDNCYNYLLNFGFTTLVDGKEINGKIFSDRTLSTALGGITTGVTQLEVTAAYGAIANGGIYNKPSFYTKVLDHDGNVILEADPEPRRVLKEQSAYVLTNMMQDVLTRGTGGLSRFKEVKMPIAGKTGTTTDTKDLSFVGYTPYYVAGIWLGFDQPKPMNEDNGYHKRLWSDIMEKIHAELEYKEFERPEGLTSASICTQSGKLAISGLCDSDPRGSMIRSEIFVAGTQPTDSCDVHVSIRMDTSTGMRAGEHCPAEVVSTEVRIVRPIPYNGGEYIGDQPYEVKREVLDGPECTVHAFGAVPEGYYVDPETGELAPLMSSIVDDEPVEEQPEEHIPTPTPTPTPTQASPGSTPRPGPTFMPTPTPAPTPTPVPEYTHQPAFGSPTPTPAHDQQVQPQDNNLPVMDDPVSIDEYEY